MFASRIANYVSRFTLYFVRMPLFAVLLPWLLTHLSFAIPINRLHETKTLLAFHHPKPIYPLHILLIPKQDLKSLTDLTSADADFLADLFEAVKMLVEQYDLVGPGYRLIARRSVPGHPTSAFPLGL